MNGDPAAQVLWPGAPPLPASGIDEVTGTLYVFGGLTNPAFLALGDGWKLKLREQ